eukprot:636149-Rhodomonas_salina.2
MGTDRVTTMMSAPNIDPVVPNPIPTHLLIPNAFQCEDAATHSTKAEEQIRSHPRAMETKLTHSPLGIARQW